MIKAKIQIHHTDLRDALQVLYKEQITPTKVKERDLSSKITFWIIAANEDALYQLLEALNRVCTWSGATVLKKKTIKAF